MAMTNLFLSLLLMLWYPLAIYAQNTITKADYLQAMIKAEAELWQEYQQSLEKWRQADPAERDPEPPKAGRHLVRMPALLYQITGEKKYAERARAVMLNMIGPDAYYNYLALKQIDGSGVLSAADLRGIEGTLLASAEHALKYWVEWGAMNLAAQGVINNLASAITYFPNHPDRPKWRQKLDINVSASWGRWSIEDSQIYIPAWLKPLMEYAELMNREDEYYALPMTKYYLDYLVQLVTPGGQIVEFGDGRYGRGYTWDWAISVLEKGATIYRDGRMKWAAHRIFSAHYQELGHLPRVDICQAYLWADDSVVEQVPTDPSRLVLEDYVGKKVVFRSGWDANATYLFLNYMDDAPFGLDGKAHMVNTINVETEKNHHGHADENAIGLLMKDGCILLYESGYRETASTGPDGEFRADVYHNKLIARQALADPNERLLPFLLNGGRYQPVNTQLSYFRNFNQVDLSRTRLTDAALGYQWDRLINYVRGKEWFVVFDIVKILKDGEFTLANLFYTQNIGAFDIDNPIWFDTYYSTIAWMPNLAPFYAGEENQQKTRLLIYFPEGKAFRIGAEQLRNNSQTEWAVYAARADSFKTGDLLVFTTLLIPHSRHTDPRAIVSDLAKIKIFQAGNGYGLQLSEADGFIQINTMLDLEAEYLAQNIRPRYNFDSGKAVYGDLLTDASYCYLNKVKLDLHYAFFKASKLVYKDQLIFAAERQIHGQDNGSYLRWGVPKWVAWEDKAVIK